MSIPNEIPFSVEQWVIVDSEVKELLKKGAIVQSSSESDEFISTIFIVAKPNGKFRPVINLRYLNEFVHYNHFKQETFSVVLDLLQENDFMAKIDMRDAYFSIPIHDEYQKYLKFSWNGILYKFVCLPFGLKSAPFLFTKILKPVFACFRHQNIRCSYYIDDSLNMNGDSEVCLVNTHTMVDTLTALGFTINHEKSVLVPSQRIVFFGFFIDSVQFKVFLTEEKVQKLVSKADILLNNGIIIVRDLASFIGLIINAFHAILEAPLHYRCLERDKTRGLGQDIDYDNEVILSQDSRQELLWWVQNASVKNGKRIRPKQVCLHCRSDASLMGYGALDLDSNRHVSARWRFDEYGLSINHLELLAIFYALQALYSSKVGVHIGIQSDNICAIKYINDMGGIVSKPMDSLAKQIWDWCIHRDIFISASYIPGALNTADYFSRHFSDTTEWMLKREIFSRLCRQFFVPDMDLFASRLNNQVDTFVSWFMEPGAFHCDAFTLSWQDYNPYIFPPFNLVGKVLNKIVQDRVDKAILIFPYWKSQSWFPVLLDNISSFPVRLPRHRDLLTLAHDGSHHPLCRSLKIIAVSVSGRRCNTEGFRRQLQTLSPGHGRRVHGSNTVMPGISGLFGTISGLKIPFGQLRL